jgi:hypothetical protein
MTFAADEYQGLRKARHGGLVDQRFFHSMLFSKYEYSGVLGGRFRVAQANRSRIAMRLLSFSHCRGLESGDTPQNCRLEAVPETCNRD